MERQNTCELTVTEIVNREKQVANLGLQFKNSIAQRIVAGSLLDRVNLAKDMLSVKVRGLGQRISARRTYLFSWPKQKNCLAEVTLEFVEFHLIKDRKRPKT